MYASNFVQKYKSIVMNLSFYNKLMIPTQESIIAAQNRIKHYIHKTPLVNSTTINKMAGTSSLYFKCQNMQKIGVFKIRGVCNKLLTLDPEVKSVCTHSSGNHGMALSYMAKQLGLKAYVVIPENSPQLKKRSVQGYGAKLIISGSSDTERENACNQACEKYKAQLVHSDNDFELIAGQATCAKQIFDQMPNKFDYLLFPIGGGGLASGTVLASKYFGNGCKAIGVQPQLAGDAYLSIRDKKLHPQFPPITIADGLRVSLGQKAFEILSQNMTVDDIILVSEMQIVNATQLVFQRMKMVIQTSSATVVAAVLKDKRFKNKNVCCIISGGNIDMSTFFNGLRTKVQTF